MGKKPLGTEPATTKSKRLDVAARLLQALIPMAGLGNTIILDAPETIHFFSKLAYKYTDELLKYEGVDSVDIEEVMPKFTPPSSVIPAGVMRKIN